MFEESHYKKGIIEGREELVVEGIAVDDGHISKDLAKLTIDPIIQTSNFIGHVKVKQIEQVLKSLLLFVIIRVIKLFVDYV